MPTYRVQVGTYGTRVVEAATRRDAERAAIDSINAADFGRLDAEPDTVANDEHLRAES